MECNLCGNNEFIDMKSRQNVKCKSCGSLERTRLLWLYLKEQGLNKDSKVLHMAPEKGIYNKLSKIIDPNNYITADFEPKRYPFSKRCEKIDLCDLSDQPSYMYDLIIHVHVLEHTPCNIAYTLFHLHRMLKEKGRHICVIPFMSGKYDESFQDLSDEERTKRFGQYDHVRRIGKEDINLHLGKLINIPDKFDATENFSVQDLRNANIPESHWKGFHAGTVLNLKRSDMKLLKG